MDRKIALLCNWFASLSELKPWLSDFDVFLLSIDFLLSSDFRTEPAISELLELFEEFANISASIVAHIAFRYSQYRFLYCQYFNGYPYMVRNSGSSFHLQHCWKFAFNFTWNRVTVDVLQFNKSHNEIDEAKCSEKYFLTNITDIYLIFVFHKFQRYI